MIDKTKCPWNAIVRNNFGLSAERLERNTYYIHSRKLRVQSSGYPLVPTVFKHFFFTSAAMEFRRWEVLNE